MSPGSYDENKAEKGLYAYLQNGANATRANLLVHMQGLLKHGCKKCGSIPPTPGNNFINTELTIDEKFMRNAVVGCVGREGIRRDFGQGCEVGPEEQRGTTELIGAMD